MKKIAIFNVLLLLAFIFFPARAASEENAVAVTDVYSLFNELKSENYKPEFDDPVAVTGYVIETGISIYATPYISLSNEKNGTVYAICVLPRTDALKLKDFKKGEKVALKGNYYAFRDKAVIKKCKKIETAPENAQ
jgi:hypothetical protein